MERVDLHTQFDAFNLFFFSTVWEWEAFFFFPRASFFYIEKNLMLFTLAGEESGHVRMLVYNDDYIPGCDTFERRVK